jgi:hypothetical protein
MNKKVIYIGLGLLGVAGVGFYFWNKSKQSAQKSVAESDEKKDSVTTNIKPQSVEKNAPTSKPSNTISTTPKKAPLETRKEKRKACGSKPAFKGKKRDLWQKCVNDGGISSFEGYFDNENMFSEFTNNLDLDL